MVKTYLKATFSSLVIFFCICVESSMHSDEYERNTTINNSFQRNGQVTQSKTISNSIAGIILLTVL